MASAQVLPNSAASSRKQEHLQAGRRRLEEFRKKKAAELAKKVSSSTSLVEVSEDNSTEKQPLDTEHPQVAESNGAGTSDRSSGAVSEPSLVVVNDDNNAVILPQQQGHGYSNDTHITSILNKDHNSFSLDQSHKYGDLGFAGPQDANQNHVNEGTNGNFAKNSGVSGRLRYETASDQDVALRHPDTNQGFHRNYYSMDESQLNEHKGFLRDLTNSNFDSSHASTVKLMPQNSVSTLLHSDPSNASLTASGTSSFSYEGLARLTANSHEVGLTLNNSSNFSNSIPSQLRQEKLSSIYLGSSSVPSLDAQPFASTAFGSHANNSSEHVPLYSMETESNSRRSRPSFLDALNVTRASSATLFRQDEPEESFKYDSEKSNITEVSQSSHFQEKLDVERTVAFSKLDTLGAPSAFDSSFNSVDDTDQPRVIFSDNSLERKHDFYSNKQNEDFAALEQHIEDLTQEKFSLQRALEAARALAESLASENSSLTDSYNQQRSVVDQLKFEMEMLQEEIKAQLGELEAVRNEYGNVLLECNAADERAKLLASEVIGLEEKALKLRSSELKLERQLENTRAEISSYKKKISSLEKDRLDMQSTINALQEEKKLLQSKLRKASTSAMPDDVRKNSTNMKNVSTSTEDLDKVPGISSQEIHDDVSVIVNDSSSFPLLPENGHSTPEFSTVNIPPDQSRTIQNINALISELALEKEELMQALATESSQSFKLKELNNELSRKLELQTQRLELLTAQNMASENPLPRKPDSHDISDNTPYADEGDEVVERVLGWIMKLFPGGPSRRRTRKLM